MRYFWDKHSKEFVEASQYRRRSLSSGAFVISDTMPDTINHADGKTYNSKRAYEKAVRAAGCVIVGNEKIPERKPIEMPSLKEDIRRTLEHFNI